VRAGSNVLFLEENTAGSSEFENVKNRIISAIETKQIDTVFICLGGAAKILCHELAVELEICAFDAGSVMRALSFAASDGHAGGLSKHHPFLIHVPFDMHMTAVERAWPNLAPGRLLAKAQCQVLRELCPQISGESSLVPASLMEADHDRIAAFRAALFSYKRKYSKLECTNKETRQIARQFRLKQLELKYCRTRIWTFSKRAINKIKRSFIG
jgi:hypothetical protein